MTISLVAVVLVGLVLGALMNVVIVRLPREQRAVGQPRCTRCGRRLALWQLLPLVGWLAQGGRGRCCGRRLAWVFPLVELLTAAAFAVFYVRYGFTAPFFYLSFVAVVLLVTGAIDWQHRFIYTWFVVLPALVALGLSAVVPGHSLLNAFIGMLVAGFLFVLLFVLALFLFPGKSAPFGLGDVYLSLFIGAAVGILNLMPALFVGMVLAGVFAAAIIVMRAMGRSNTPEYISYGSFLCVGVLAYLMARGL